MVGEQVQTGRGLGLDGWRIRSEWMGARPGWLGARPGWLENKSRMVRARPGRLENKSRMVGKLGQGPAGCSIS